MNLKHDFQSTYASWPNACARCGKIDDGGFEVDDCPEGLWEEIARLQRALEEMTRDRDKLSARLKVASLGPAPAHLPPGFLAVLNYDHIYYSASVVVAKGMAYPPGYYYTTPFAELVGPFNSVEDTCDAIERYAEAL